MKLNIINYPDTYLQCIKESDIFKVRRYKMTLTIERCMFREIDLGSVAYSVKLTL